MIRDDAPITVSLKVSDPALSDRLAALLGGVAGLRLVGDAELADVELTGTDHADAGVLPQPPAGADQPLTTREREVLALLAEGASNKAIARRLAVSVHTAKFHVGPILDKLDATGRTDAVAHAARLGLIML